MLQVRDRIAAYLDRHNRLPKIVGALCKAAMKGNVKAAMYLIDQRIGKSVQSILVEKREAVNIGQEEKRQQLAARLQQLRAQMSITVTPVVVEPEAQPADGEQSGSSEQSGSVPTE